MYDPAALHDAERTDVFPAPAAQGVYFFCFRAAGRDIYGNEVPVMPHVITVMEQPTLQITMQSIFFGDDDPALRACDRAGWKPYPELVQK